MDITDRHLKMIDPRGFDQLFEQEIPKHDTYEEAFKALNREYFRVFGKFRYKNYESYRKTRAERLQMA